MVRFLVALALYAGAFVCIYAAFQLAPDMKWPHTQIEWIATQMLVIGLCAKTAGHVVLLWSTPRTKSTPAAHIDHCEACGSGRIIARFGYPCSLCK
jgi:hypothetical protein